MNLLLLNRSDRWKCLCNGLYLHWFYRELDSEQNGLVYGDPPIKSIHYDLYGSIAEFFEESIETMIEYFGVLKAAVMPFNLFLKFFAVMENRSE